MPDFPQLPQIPWPPFQFPNPFGGSPTPDAGDAILGPTGSDAASSTTGPVRKPTADEYTAFAKYYAEQHGPLEGGKPAEVSPPYEADPDSKLPGAKRATVNPTLEFRFQDGTTVQARWDGQSFTTTKYDVSPRYQKKVNDEANNRPVAVSPGTTLIDPKTNQPVYTAPEKPTTPEEKARLQMESDRLQLEREREAREAEAQKRREAAEAERDRINILVQNGKLKADDALQRYKEWFDKNVTIPMQVAAEERARRNEAMDQAKFKFEQQKAGSDYELARSKAGLEAGQFAVTASQKLLPYMAGPAFGEQFAQAVNATANRSKGGFNFTKDAFQYTPPNYDEISQRATAAALSAISPYAASLQAAPVADVPQPQYSAPATVDTSTAPEMPPPPELY